MTAVVNAHPHAGASGLSTTTIRGLRAALNGRDLTAQPLRCRLVVGRDVPTADHVCLVIWNTDLAAVFPVSTVVAIQDRRAKERDLEEVTRPWGIDADALMPQTPVVEMGTLVSRLQKLLASPHSPQAQFRVGLWDPVLNGFVVCEVILLDDELFFVVPDAVVGRIQAAFGRAWFASLTSEEPT